MSLLVIAGQVLATAALCCGFYLRGRRDELRAICAAPRTLEERAAVIAILRRLASPSTPSPSRSTP